MTPPEPDPDPEPDPEPDPDPPTPSKPVYTYDSSSNAGVGTLYSNIRSSGVLCQVITTFLSSYLNFTKLLYKNGTYYCADQYDDVDTGITTVYWLQNGNVYAYTEGSSSNVGSYTVTGQSPSGYYTNITSGNFTLEASS